MLYSNIPLNYLFFFLYLVLTGGCIFFSDYILVLWVLIELQMILYLVISFPLFRSFHASLILYFLIQSVSSLLILRFSFFSFSVLLFGFCLKMGLFPFFGWYISCLTSFPSLSLFLALTFQKLPSFLFFNLFFHNFRGFFFFILILFGVLGGIGCLGTTFSFRFLIVWSSLLANVWFFLRLTQSLRSFLLYFFAYCALVYLFFWGFEGGVYRAGWLIILLFALGGFPPFPLFFLKVYILYSAVFTVSVPAVLLTLLSSVITIYIYCSFSLSRFLLEIQKG